jgi:AcrR family transcriptional regulator
VPRPLDPKVDEAIVEATVRLLAKKGFSTMTMAEVAVVAGVGKPAIYRRYSDKAELVAAVIRSQMVPLEIPDHDDTKAELGESVERGLPPDGAGYLRMVAGLVAVEERHPELIESLRTSVIEPRRAVVIALLERGVERGDLRADLDPVAALDFIAGSYLARALAGLDTGPGWRSKAFEVWWENIRRPAPMVSSQTS